MKIKTAELTGVVLDWAVAKCEGYFDSMLNVKRGVIFGLVRELQFSIDGSQGVPIIEREKSVFLSQVPPKTCSGAQSTTTRVWRHTVPLLSLLQ